MDGNKCNPDMDKRVVICSSFYPSILISKKCFIIDQKPIGRSKTSCPATYTGIFDRIRALFARESGLPAGLFSVNSEDGCKICNGDGAVHFHVGFGNFIDIDCEACEATGFIPEACEVMLGGKNIRDVLQMTVDEASVFFAEKDKAICTMLKTLQGVGMGYIQLGQKTPTISGGESQRIKLAKELAKSQNGNRCIYILDEPTTGLSFSDSKKLMLLLQELVDSVNSIIVTEHDPYVLSNCDYIIELGLGGGSEGGQCNRIWYAKTIKRKRRFHYRTVFGMNYTLMHDLDDYITKRIPFDKQCTFV